MPSAMKRRVVTLLNDELIPTEEKIEVLRQLEADALSRERSATEGMAPVDGEEDAEDLHAIEMALRKLGQEPVEGGAATL